METSRQPDIFTTRVVPIMNKVRDELNRLKAEESARHNASYRLKAEESARHNASYRMLMAGAAGPDGGMAAMDCYRSQVNYTGKWNTKTVEDYISQVEHEDRRRLYQHGEGGAETAAYHRRRGHGEEDGRPSHQGTDSQVHS